MNNENALDNFTTSKHAVMALLQNLTAITDDHLGYSPDEITWTKACEMLRLQSNLEEIAESVGLDAEEIIFEDAMERE